MRNQNHNNSDRYVVSIFSLLLIIGLGIIGTPAAGFAESGKFSNHAVYAAALQDAGQAAPPADSTAPATPPATAPPAPKKVELPEGDGKPIATEYCQDCHRLTNLTRSHKSADDWHDTVELMIDRGARLPQENVDALVEYLAKNFGPKADTPAPAAATAPASAAAPAPDAATAATPAPAAATATTASKTVVLPDGDGKDTATESCQACHRLTNLTRAHKSLDDWRATVQLMTDRGADIPADKLETLIQYLAKNFGPKTDAAGASTPSVSTAPGSTSQSQ